MSVLPFHPFTGQQALGFTSRGPIWPVIGGSQPQGEPLPQPAQPPATPPAQPPQQQSPDKGFPENTPLEQMSTEQLAAYWKHYARKHEGDAKAYTKLGLTPEQVQQLVARNEELEAENQTATDKAIKDAQKAAKAEAEEVWKTKYLTSELKASAATFFPDQPEKLEAFMATATAAAFVNEAGEVDTDKVTMHLTTLFGTRQQNGSGQQQAPNWGQHGGQPPATPPGQGGRAEAERRIKARQGNTT